MSRGEANTVNSRAPVNRIPTQSGNKVSGLQHFAQSAAVQLPVLILLLAAAALWEAKQLTAFSRDEIWVHLRTGIWILQNHAIPRTGLFSQFSASPWIDSSWLYDAVCGAVYRALGLRAVPVLLMVFKVAVAGVSFLLAGGRRNFWAAVVLCVWAQLSLPFLQPLPNVISICFFGLALYWMLEASQKNELAHLPWLPLLFWLWANLDAQLVLGLALVAIFLLAEIAERATARLGIGRAGLKKISLLHLVAVGTACLIATLLTPYSIHLIPAGVQSEYSLVLFKNFDYMAAMSFRQPQHFALILLLFSACLGLGRRRSHDLFKILLLMLWAILAFRVQRDSWTIVLPAVAILGEAIAKDRDESGASEQGWPKKRYLYVSAGVAILLTLAFFFLPDTQALQTRLERVFPVKACEYIQNSHLPGPIFNDYRWGGYLMWKLPEYPVAMDERLSLYGDEFSRAYFETIMGKRRMETLPGFTGERMILLPVKISMAKALTTIPVLQQQFREVYRDNLAIVLVRQ